MTTLEKWQFAQTNMDESLMDESLHEDFKFINHSQGKEFSKRDLIDWVMSGDIKREEIRILYENEEIAVEHSFVSFKDGNKQAVLGFYTKKDNKLFSAETGATNISS